jgi:putative spermidine/putrescine transport system substrate-binding protein
MDKIEQHIKKPFEEKYGVEIVYEQGNNADRLNKLTLAKDNPTVDVVHFSDYFTQIAINEGLIEDMDLSNIPNVERLYDIAKHPLGEQYGPAYTLYNYGLVYRTDKVSAPVTSWKDLWRDEFQDFVSLPDITTTQGPATVIMTALTWGSGPQDEDTAFAKLGEVKDNVIKFYSRSSELISLIQQEEVWIAPVQRFAWGNLANTGLPLAWVNPSEGSVVTQNLICLAKGTKNADLGYKYIDFVLSDEVQEAMALALVDSPANQYVEVPDDVADRLTYGKDVIEGLIVLDIPYILEVRDAWVDRWNREIAQ